MLGALEWRTADLGFPIFPVESCSASVKHMWFLFKENHIEWSR